ncbi:oxidoreductase [Microbacterium sp. 4R-513]|uniref:ferredoxin reductase family protein n=1 Tax=Microbacterium sp. 4R-513 TaxID=2567934 RepID=UPI0013E12AF6|nr:ferredoxin reductase family protein [Microbacterium sp. 4R-513]QIG40856.1 oxidoreductase [Microbacterium sp. 4R-513]
MTTSATIPATATAPTAVPRAARRSTPAKAWNAAAVTVIWLTSLFVVALWVAGGGLHALAGMDGETITSLGRIAGLVSANLLLYQVLLMARVPLFERGFGRDGITRMHRRVGFWSFWLLLAHIVLVTAGYAVAAQVNVFAQLWTLVVDYPGMLLATAGTVLLIMVVATSIRRARKRLRYESWHLLHLYGYLGVGLALPHQLWTGADFLSSPAATTYWWTLWAVAAASVVVFRVGLPLARSWRHRLRVTDVAADGSRGVTVRVTGRELHRLGAKPGQFFVWRFLDGSGWTRGHPFSLAAAPRAESLEIGAQVVGDGTARLRSLKPGTPVLVEGPYGRMTGDARTGTKLLMIAAGAGIAPLVSILEGERYAPGDATLITRDHDVESGLLRGSVRELIARRGLRHFELPGGRSRGSSPWIPATHDAWTGRELIRYFAPDLEAYDAYVCGPQSWMDAVVRDLRAAGMPAHAIHTESFTV